MASRRSSIISAAHLISLLLVLSLTGCAGSIRRVEPTELDTMIWPQIVGLTTNTSVNIELDRQAPVTIEGDTLHGTLGGKPYEIALSDVRVLWVKSSASDVFEMVIPGAVFLLFFGLVIIGYRAAARGGGL
jgi:hypothetical protein